MRSALTEHLLSIFVVALLLLLLVFTVRRGEALRQEEETRMIGPYIGLKFVDFGNPLHVALFRETLNAFSPGTPGKNDSLLQAIQAYRMEQFANPELKTGAPPRTLDWAALGALAWMYAQFILVYLVVIVLTFSGAQTLAMYRFIKMKQHRSSYLAEAYALLARTGGPDVPQRGGARAGKALFLLLKAGAKGVLYTLLFAPAYVVAYSIKTQFDTNSLPFMILLGTVTNGVLINYANKFYTFLVAESRKGYVLTAIVKNLHASYAWGREDGIPYRALLLPARHLHAHVFRHIYLNARYQYLPTLKEHASFLITGLIIIEMALNIQGHLGYDLLQSILYKHYDVVAVIVLAIFLMVKATEIAVDVWCFREAGRYENRE